VNTGTNETKIYFFTTIERKWSNCIVCISFRNINFTSGSAIIGSQSHQDQRQLQQNTSSASGANAGFSPDLISAIRLSAIAINLSELVFYYPFLYQS
jgi:hypothetical protein